MADHSDRFGDALAIAKAKYGRTRKPQPWGAALIATALVFIIIGGIVALLALR